MDDLTATLHTLGVWLTTTTDRQLHKATAGRERGSVTIEQILWALAVIVIAGLVIAGITAYVNGKIGELG